MAKAKRNGKTHPKVSGDPDSYVAPDRPEILNARDGESTEVVDLNSGTGEVDLGAPRGGDTAGDDGGAEGGTNDARGDDQRIESDGGRGTSTARGERDTRRTARGASARGDGDNDTGDDDANYSRKVRARVQRERANLNRERQLRQQTEATLAEERTARQQLADRLERVERAQTEVAGNADVKSLEAQITALVPQITAATEAGETAKALDLQIKLGELQGDLKVLKYDLRKRQEAADAAKAANAGRRDQRADSGTVPIDPVAQQTSNEFIRMNRHWWNRTKNKEAREDAVAIDKEVLADLEAGELDFEPYSDEHFEEIAHRLHQTYPDLEICDLAGETYNFGDDEDDDDMNDRDDRGRDRDRRDTRREPVRRDDRRDARGDRAPVGRGPGGIGRGGRRTPSDAELARQGKVTLEQADFNTMRTFGMDPNNPEHKKYFAKERQRSILTDDRRNGGGR